MLRMLVVCAVAVALVGPVSVSWAIPMSTLAELNGAAPAQQIDEVLKWNGVWLNAIRDFGAGGGNVPPTDISRQGAIIHASIFDSINSIKMQFQPYKVSIDVPRDTSPQAAVASAGYKALSFLYPQFQNRFDLAWAESLAAIPNGAAKTQGIALGSAVADAIIASRANDGSSNNTPYIFNGGPGQYQPTPPQFSGNLIGPNWHAVTPWVLSSGSQFRPPAPPALDSNEYLAAFNEVKSLGDINSTTRTPEQTQIASFWANDRAGTFSRVGHTNHIARVASLQEGLDLYENARLFGLLNIADADAVIAGWDAKYATDLDFWRPVTGIQQADRDGNPNTIADPNWIPLSHDPNVNGFTPFFPAYVSGHAILGGVSSSILEKYFGTDDLPLTIGTDDPGYIGGLRSYDTLSEIARENGVSRIYLGIHWRFDVDEGLAAGDQIGDYIFGQCMQPIPEADVILLLLAAAPVALRRRLR